MFESPVERAALASVWEDSAHVGAITIPGQFDEPAGDDLLIEGMTPTFLAQRSDLSAASVRAGPDGTQIDTVETQDGRTLGPFRVVRWMPADDGAFVVVGLQTL